jgi:hypothetical protein
MPRPPALAASGGRMPILFATPRASYKPPGASRRDDAFHAAHPWTPSEIAWQASSPLLAQGGFYGGCAYKPSGASRRDDAFHAAHPWTPGEIAWQASSPSLAQGGFYGGCAYKPPGASRRDDAFHAAHPWTPSEIAWQASSPLLAQRGFYFGTLQHPPCLRKGASMAAAKLVTNRIGWDARSERPASGLGGPVPTLRHCFLVAVGWPR